MSEIWLHIKGFEGHYQVSDMGRVRGLSRYVHTERGLRFVKGRVLQPGRCKGYLFVALSRYDEQTLLQVHQVVATHFIPNPDDKPEVNHKDLDKTNNCKTNLEWVTSSENKIHYHLSKAS